MPKKTRKNLDSPLALDDLMAGVFQRLKKLQASDVQKIWAVWDRSVGPEVANIAQPKAFKKGVLYVAVASAPWSQELEYAKAQMRQCLNSELGKALIKDLRFKVGALPAR